MATYTVREGENIFDVSLNSIGSLYDMDLIMDLNGIQEVDYVFASGQEIEIPDTVDSKVIEIANKRPFNSTSLPNSQLVYEVNFICAKLA